MDEMSPSFIACEMISAILSNLLWASSLMASCFSCFMVKVLKDFCVMTVARDRLVQLRVMPIGRPTPLVNAAMKTPTVITVDVIRPVSTMPVIVLNCFLFLAIRSRTSISSNYFGSISVNFFQRYVCGSCGAVEFKSG